MQQGIVHAWCVVMSKEGVSTVNDLWSQTGGLPLDSTATQHTFAGVLLWLRCPMHRG